MFQTNMHPHKSLSLAQKQRLLHYEAIWETRISGRHSMNRDQVAAAIAVLYRALGLRSPEIRYFSGPGDWRSALVLTDRARSADERRMNQRHAYPDILLIILAGILLIVMIQLTSFRETDFGFILTMLIVFPLCLWACWFFCIRLPSLIIGWIIRQSKMIAKLNAILWNLMMISYYIWGVPLWISSYLQTHLHTLAVQIYIGSYVLIVFLGILVLTFRRSWQRYCTQKFLRIQWQQHLERQIIPNLSSRLQRQIGFSQKGAAPTNKKESSTEFHSYELWIKPWYPKKPEAIAPIEWRDWMSQIDFCVAELGYEIDRPVWEALQTVMSECGWILPFQRVCWVIDRPTVFQLDDQHRLHNSFGNPAIAFADGHAMYAHHGMILPEKYGSVVPHQWKSQWVLEEKNAELRRLLIQEIGYGRLCQELRPTVLNSWREYTLLRFDQISTNVQLNGAEAEEEPIVILKMTCPSTHHIHALRVPPQSRSARKAAQWVNWDIDPEQFSHET